MLYNWEEGGGWMYNWDKKKLFWNALTENYLNISLLNIHTEFIIQDKFSLY